MINELKDVVVALAYRWRHRDRIRREKIQNRNKQMFDAGYLWALDRLAQDESVDQIEGECWSRNPRPFERGVLECAADHRRGVTTGEIAELKSGESK